MSTVIASQSIEGSIMLSHIRVISLFKITSIALVAGFFAFTNLAKAQLFLVEQSEDYNLLRNYLIDLKSWESQWSRLEKTDQANFSKTYYKEILGLNRDINKQTKSLNKKLNLAFKNYNINKDDITQNPYTEVVKPCEVNCGSIPCIDSTCWPEETWKAMIPPDDGDFECITCVTACTYPLVLMPLVAVTAGIAQGAACLFSAPFRLRVSGKKTEKKISDPNIGNELGSLIQSLEFYLQQVESTAGRERLGTLNYRELQEQVEYMEKCADEPNQLSIEGVNYHFTPEAIKAIKAILTLNEGKLDFNVYRPKRMKTLSIEVGNSSVVKFLFEIAKPVQAREEVREVK